MVAFLFCEEYEVMKGRGTFAGGRVAFLSLSAIASHTQRRAYAL